MDALPEFKVLNPITLDEMIVARTGHPDSKLLGGGTDLVVNIRRGIVAPPVLIEIAFLIPGTCLGSALFSSGVGPNSLAEM